MSFFPDFFDLNNDGEVSVPEIVHQMIIMDEIETDVARHYDGNSDDYEYDSDSFGDDF